MSTTHVHDRNRGIVDEFRANAGKVGGYFEGKPVLLLTTTGAKSGRQLTSPLMYNTDGDRILIFASKGGAPSNPDWYYNLLANPRVTLEVGGDTFDATATELTGDERDQVYARHAAEFPQFAEYERNTTRKIPVIALDRVK